MKSYLTENVPAEPITSETMLPQFANSHAPLLNSSTKEDVLNAHSTYSTEPKLKDALVLTVFTSITTEYVKKSQLSQSLVMPVSSSKAQKGAQPAHQDARHAPAPPFVPLVSKMVSVSLVEFARLSAVMELLLGPNNVMIRTALVTMAALLVA